jgi:hypothetical protein
MRGRHFGFLVSLCAVWITARVGFLSLASHSAIMIPKHERLAKITAAPVVVATAPDASKASHSGSVSPTRRIQRATRLEPPPALAVISLQIRPPRSHQELLMSGRQVFAPPTAYPVPEAPRKRDGSAFDLYAYSFIRAGSRGGAPLGSGQYGGSQSGLIATYALSHFAGKPDKTKLALLLRGAIAHDNIAEREVAAGLRWHPVRKVPISLTVERRFRNARSDAFAAYVAGGVSEVALPLDFRLDGFAQTGFVTRKDGGAFFDASARAERSVSQIGPLPIRAGVGLWTGGQEGIFRIDAGPTISGQIPVADTRLRISADWRFRIAGDATPASGPALTLSTAF